MIAKMQVAKTNVGTNGYNKQRPKTLQRIFDEVILRRPNVVVYVAMRNMLISSQENIPCSAPYMHLGMVPHICTYLLVCTHIEETKNGNFL